MTTEVVAWNQRNAETKTIKDGFVYVLQATTESKRDLNKLVREASDWRVSGQGYDKLNEKYIIILRREFEDKKSWLEFARTLSFEVQEINSTGKKKKINGKKRRKSNSNS